LSLNYDKTRYVHFRTNNSLIPQADISYKNRYIVNDTITQFLDITIDSSLSWKNHIDELAVNLSKACYTVRSLRPFVSHESLRMIYYSHFHTVMSYSIILWGNSAHSINIFKLQKRIVRIITNSGNRVSCRLLFRKLDILPFYSQYLLPLLIFVIDNISPFKTNSELYEINTRNINSFHLSQPRLTIYRNGDYYMGIKEFNHLPSHIKRLSDDRNDFKNTLKNYLLILFTHWMIFLIAIVNSYVYYRCFLCDS
jgi:hypothetical protein